MGRRYVGIDLHRRRSVFYAMDGEGERLFCERIANDSLRMLEVVSGAGVDAEVVIEATYGWYWAVDVLTRRDSRCISRTRRAMTGARGG